MPEEIAKDLSKIKIDDDEEEKTENKEDEERPAISNTQALKLDESLCHFLCCFNEFRAREWPTQCVSSSFNGFVLFFMISFNIE